MCQDFGFCHATLKGQAGKEEIKEWDQGCEKKFVRTQLWLNLLRGHLDWTPAGMGGQQLFKIPLRRQIYPRTRPGFTLKQLPPSVNKVAINHLSTRGLNHGSKPHCPCIELNLWIHPRRSLLHSWNWSVFQALLSPSSTPSCMNHFPDALIIVYTFIEQLQRCRYGNLHL